MRILVNGKLYDSTKTPILLVFDDNEKEIFNNLNRFVSAPENTTTEEKQELIDTYIEGVNQCPICEEQYEHIEDAQECFEGCGGMNS